jgi:glycosyltransferase involved in cell wall biosynthesis
MSVFHFKIVIPSYNTVKWLRKTLDSVAEQSYKDFDVCVIDDASTQPEQKEIIREYVEKYGWKAIYRQKNHGAVANFIDGIALLNPSDRDVIIMLDGDDWLYDKNVLKKLDEIYSNEEVSLTYGQFITYPRWEIGFCRPPKEGELSDRDSPWIYSALRTFQYFLWKELDPKDLKDSNGDYYKTAWDLAIMYPLIEMAGNSIKCVHDILYVYNHDNPLNDHVLDLKKQQAVAAEIRDKNPYDRLVNGSCSNLPATFWQRLKQQTISWKNRIFTLRTYELLWAKLTKKWK